MSSPEDISDSEQTSHADCKDAFLEYVTNMRPSVGQKFILHLVQDNGLGAFQDFWEHLLTAREHWPHKITLQEHEEKALAKALFANSRRDFLRRASGMAMCVSAGWLGREGAREYVDYGRRKSEKTVDAVIAVGKLGGAFGLAMGGLSVISMDVPSERTIAQIAQGPEGEARVRRLVASLDTLFQPVELAMRETGVRRG